MFQVLSLTAAIIEITGLSGLRETASSPLGAGASSRMYDELAVTYAFKYRFYPLVWPISGRVHSNRFS